MKTLPEQYAGRGSVNGYHFKLVERNECAAIYSQSRVPNLPPNGKACAYEVILIRVRQSEQTPRFHSEAGEYFPSDEHWGSSAWTCHTLERAREKFAEVSTPERIAAANAARAKIEASAA